MTIGETKTEARRRARTLLAGLDPAEAGKLSLEVSNSFRSLPEYREAGIVLAFLSMSGEIRTDFLVEACLSEGRRLAVPRIEGGDIAFVPLDGNYHSWPRDRMGIPEPQAGLGALSFAELGRLRVLVAAPGLAFDRSGNRLGRGKGYYDRFLAAARSAAGEGGGSLFVCGFCYSFQVVEALPADERDVPVDAVATEAGFIRFGAARAQAAHGAATGNRT